MQQAPAFGRPFTSHLQVSSNNAARTRADELQVRGGACIRLQAALRHRAINRILSHQAVGGPLAACEVKRVKVRTRGFQLGQACKALSW